MSQDIKYLDIKHHVLRFHKRLSADQYQRYRSWEHCYRHFRTHQSFKTDSDIDLAALHLGFFLASWGMYRGSSFLLQKDFRVHIPIVQELLKKEYTRLWNIDVESLTASSEEVRSLFQLVDGIKELYRQGNPTVNGLDNPADATDTLVTKILLGTMCCAPAYDQNFTEGLGCRGLIKSFGRNSYLEVVDFYKRHAARFKEAGAEIANYGTPYPTMKLVDMYFWSVGYEAERQKKSKTV